MKTKSKKSKAKRAKRAKKLRLVAIIFCFCFALLVLGSSLILGMNKPKPEPEIENSSQDTSSNSEKTVVIDPGHGTSANSRENEGENELGIGLKLKDLLAEDGYHVVVTHESIGETIGGAKTEYDDNVARAEIANQAKADVVIRIHSDSHVEDKFAIYYPQKQEADRNGKVGPESEETIANSIVFFSQILTSMQSAGFTPMKAPIHPDTDSNWSANYVFSSNLRVPSAIALLEVYGHNDSKLVNKYKNADEQSKVAEALNDAIDSYLGS